VTQWEQPIPPYRANEVQQLDPKRTTHLLWSSVPRQYRIPRASLIPVNGALYPTLQAIKLGGEEDAAPIRIESMSDFQLEQLIARLSKS
jgi:hypothetical protein